MKHFQSTSRLLLAAAMAAGMVACSDDDKVTVQQNEEAQSLGKAVGNFKAEEWYPGGQLGTTDNVGASAYSDQTPAVDNDPTLFSAFFQGEQLFERQYTETSAPFKGLGPASVRRSCLDCHPEYGHGKRMNAYETKYGNGNGYLLVVYNPSKNNPAGPYNADNSDGWSDDGAYVAEVTGMPQTQAVKPFKAPIDESQIQLKWLTLDKMASGLPFEFPDGEKYQLIYPDIRIPQSAFRTSPTPYETGDVAVRLESTIGVIGTGLIDAIPQDSIKAQYAREAAWFKSQGLDVTEYINPNFWDADANDWGPGALYNAWSAPGHRGGILADGTRTDESYKLVKRFTYALTRASLQDGPGANAIWNITNVSRPDRPYLYTTAAWAKAMSEDPEVIAAIQADPTSIYHGATEAETKERVLNLLSPGTNQFDNQWSGTDIKPEMTADQFYAFMVWHRGLAVPRARNLQDPEVQRGKQLFNEIGCATCHRPRWETKDDNYWMPEMLAGRKLPRFQNQVIYPYSDFIQHKLYMKNGIHGSWCRTTPLWGRGLSLVNTGAEDRLHDCRARNEVEAIMWHAYSKKSHSYDAALRFYNLPKADRDAVVKFLRAI